MKMKRILLALGTVATVITPIVAVVSCGTSPKTEKDASVDYSATKSKPFGWNLLTLGKLSDNTFVTNPDNPEFPNPVKRETPKDPTDPSKGTNVVPAYGAIKVLNEGLDTKSLDDYWSTETKWWGTSFAYALGWALHGENVIGPDSDWDGDNGARNGAVAKKLVDSIFPDGTSKRENFVKWADKWIKLRFDINTGTTQYGKEEAKLVSEYSHDFGLDAIKLSIGMFKVWQARWGSKFDTAEHLATIMRTLDFKADADEIKTLLDGFASKTPLEKKTPSVTKFSQAEDVEQLSNSTNADVKFEAGYYNNGLVATADGVTQKVAGIRVAITKAPALPLGMQDPLAVPGSVELTVEGGPWSGPHVKENDPNWAQSSSPVKMVLIDRGIGPDGNPAGDHLFVREDALEAVTGKSNLADAITKYNTLAEKPNSDKLGKMAVWFAKDQFSTAIATSTEVEPGFKTWNIASMGMVYKFAEETATGNGGAKSDTFATEESMDKFVEWGVNQLKPYLANLDEKLKIEGLDI